MIRRFRTSEDGYALVLAVIALPAFLAMALLIIDVSRGNNAQSDLQAAADSLALAGARELNGKVGAISRAKAAMERIDNSVSFLRPSGNGSNIWLTYEVDNSGQPSPDNEYTVVFLSDIPDEDSTPITSQFLADNSTTSDSDAEYVYVGAQSRDLLTVFLNPLSALRDEVPVSATAVATFKDAACGIAPVFICNPFEGGSGDASNIVAEQTNLINKFKQGALYGILFRLIPPGSDTVGPGNFGYLDQGSGGAALGAVLAGGTDDQCFQTDTAIVDPEPGAMTSLSTPFNTRFGIYKGNYSSASLYPPDVNVRTGYDRNNLLTGNNDFWTPPGGMALPNNFDMVRTNAGADIGWIGPYTANPSGASIWEEPVAFDPDDPGETRWRRGWNLRGVCGPPLKNGVTDEAAEGYVAPSIEYGVPSTIYYEGDPGTDDPAAAATVVDAGAPVFYAPGVVDDSGRVEDPVPATPSVRELASECRVDGGGVTDLDGDGDPDDVVTGTWYPGYWEVHHDESWDAHLTANKGTLTAREYQQSIRESYPDAASNYFHDDTLPSRFDIYRYEIETAAYLTAAESDSQESGKAGVSFEDTDRRELYAALINCAEVDPQGKSQEFPVVAYGAIFLARAMGATPLPGANNKDTMDVEIFDIETFSSNSKLENFLRPEAYLVR